MKRFVEKIKESGLTRDEARRVRQGKAKKSKGYTFRYTAKNQSYSLTMKFRKSQAGRDEIESALRDVLDHLATLD